jgi:hypothetical protein
MNHGSWRPHAHILQHSNTNVACPYSPKKKNRTLNESAVKLKSFFFNFFNVNEAIIKRASKSVV